MHVRISLSHIPAPSSPSPAAAIAVLTILTCNLDSYLTPERELYSEVHHIHALSQLLYQDDAMESCGEEAVRDLRLALVRRIERGCKGYWRKKLPRPNES